MEILFGMESGNTLGQFRVVVFDVDRDVRVAVVVQELNEGSRQGFKLGALGIVQHDFPFRGMGGCSGQIRPLVKKVARKSVAITQGSARVLGLMGSLPE